MAQIRADMYISIYIYKCIYIIYIIFRSTFVTDRSPSISWGWVKTGAFSNRQAAMNDLSSGSAAGSSLDFDTPLEESASQPMGMGRYWKAPLAL